MKKMLDFCVDWGPKYAELWPKCVDRYRSISHIYLSSYGT